jgi:hypothetical protein
VSKASAAIAIDFVFATTHPAAEAAEAMSARDPGLLLRKLRFIT